MSEHKIPIPSMLYNAAVGGHVTNSQQIIDENLNKEQNDINQETVGAVPYNSITPNGMGRIVLKKNDDFKQVVEAQTNGNTIFVIKYDFTLTDNVTIPANCILQFEGGSISGAYTITGNKTAIQASLVKIFNNNVLLAGTFKNGEWDVEWFGANENVINNQIYLNHAIKQLANLHGGTLVINNECTISDTIWLMHDVSIIGKSNREGIGTWWPDGGTLIRCAFTNKDRWAMSVADKNGNEITYSQLDILDNNSQRLAIQLKNLAIVTMEDDGSNLHRYNQTPIFGGIRLCNFVNACMENVNVYGFKYGIAISYSWLSKFDRVESFGKTVGIYFGTCITTLSFIACGCRLYTDNYTGDDSQDIDFSVFNNGNNLNPPYLTNNIKNAAIVNDEGNDWQGNNITFTNCAFENYEAAVLTSKGDLVFTNMYTENIKKTVIWAHYLCDILVDNQSYWIFKGVPIVDGGYEFGGGEEVNFVIKNFPASRCWKSNSKTTHYQVFISPYVSYYDKCINNEGAWEYEKNPQKQFIGKLNTFYITHYDNNPTVDDIVFYANSIGYYNRQTYSGRIAERILDIGENNVEIHITSEHYTANNDNIISNKNITVYYDPESGYIYTGSGTFKLKNCTIYYPQNRFIQAINTNSGIFYVYNKCNINIYAFISDKYLIQLSGDEAIECNITIRNTDLLPHINNNIIKNPEFSFPYIVRVFKENGTLYRTITNPTRPTKGVPIGYVYIENGVPIYYTGDTSGSNTGWVNATGTTV